MKKISSLILPGLLLVLAGTFSLLSFAADDYVVPRTEWGQADLQGVWNFSSDVPMQRLSRYGDREFLTAEEIEQAAAQRAARDASSDSALPIGGVDESYNDFWIENAGIGDTVRTLSLIHI